MPEREREGVTGYFICARKTQQTRATYDDGVRFRVESGVEKKNKAPPGNARHKLVTRHVREMVLSALLRLQSARPSTTALLLGGGIMAVGDSVVQYGVEDRDALDKTRLAVCSAYNASVAVPLQFWYAYLDRVWPSGYFISKVLLNQLVSSSTLTPGFLATTSCVETVMVGRGLLAGLEARFVSN